ncbi:MAG: gephyrin-like molybdotransferase Glp [Myxococcota bacterium]
MITIAEALARMMPAFTPRGREFVPLDEARGRVLASDLLVREDAPPFDNSAMDGWAVHAPDVASAAENTPVVLPIAGESRAGGPPPRTLVAGSAMRIFTGAPLPAGADAVVVQEDSELTGEGVALRFASERYRHVRRKGSDLRKGDVLVTAGTPIHAGSIALLASQGIDTVEVVRRPVVAILSTGDELRDLGEAREAGTIVNSNAPMLAALVEEAGAVPLRLPRAPDQLEVVTERLREALDADLLLTSGGVSVGDYDVVREAFTQAGIEMDFWKVAIKPGKPLAFGVHDGTPAVGLPGNPVSAYVTFQLFVRPGLRRMLGDARPFPKVHRLVLDGDLQHRPGRTELVRGRWTERGVAPHGHRGSGSLASIAEAEVLIVLPAEIEHLSAGTEVSVLVLQDRDESPPF